MSQLGAEHHPSRDEIAGASEDEREAGMLIVAAEFESPVLCRVA